MDAESSDQEKAAGETQETPLCLRCLRPVDPRAYYCPYCGEAVGQLTPYLPFESIRWQAGIWGQMWRQVWSRNVSLPGRIFRLIMILWNVPILLIGLIPGLRPKPPKPHAPTTRSDDEDDLASD